MPWFSLEHSRAAYRLDFALYGAICAAMALALLAGHPATSGWALAGWTAAGGASWTLVEYLLHRHVLHGVPPFKGWHAQHHQRPAALMGSPTLMSLGLFAVFVAAPALWLIGPWPACALTFGLMSGYLAYGLTHHATHHRVPLLDPNSAWLHRRRHWHSLHHASSRRLGPDAPAPGQFGVSCNLWDHVFRTAGRGPPMP
jgi:cyclopropane-fatty-acyl-phospholipid synthase